MKTEIKKDDQAPERLVYTPTEVGALLGLGRTAVYERLRDGSLPSVRLGNRIFIPRAALEELLHRKNTPAPE